MRANRLVFSRHCFLNVFTTRRERELPVLLYFCSIHHVTEGSNIAFCWFLRLWWIQREESTDSCDKHPCMQLVQSGLAPSLETEETRCSVSTEDAISKSRCISIKCCHISASSCLPILKIVHISYYCYYRANIYQQKLPWVTFFSFLLNCHEQCK